MALASVLRSSGGVCRRRHTGRIVLARMMHFAEVRVLLAVRSSESVGTEALIEIPMQSLADVNAEAFVPAGIDRASVVFIAGAALDALAAVARVGALKVDRNGFTYTWIPRLRQSSSDNKQTRVPALFSFSKSPVKCRTFHRKIHHYPIDQDFSKKSHLVDCPERSRELLICSYEVCKSYRPSERRGFRGSAPQKERARVILVTRTERSLMQCQSADQPTCWLVRFSVGRPNSARLFLFN